MIRRYFEEEMRYLHEAGKVFAENHPEQGRYLNIDSIADRDPYVERLFEGFAFLSGRIHEQLDDELHHYTEALCTLLCPHFLKPIPSLSMVAFEPKSGEVQGTTVLKKGTEVRSGPVGDERTVCRFVTTQEVKLQPLTLKDVVLHWAPDSTTRAVLTFQVEGGAALQDLDLSPLRLHFNADPTVSSLMHLFFTRHVRQVVIANANATAAATASMLGQTMGGLADDGTITLQGQEWIRPGGFSEDEGVLPYSLHSFTGFRLLHEYLSYRRKFWCIDLHGLDRFQPTMAASTFQVEVLFDRSYPEDKRFGVNNLKLFSTPVVNIFEMDAEPLRIDHQTSEYRVIPSTRYRRGIEVYDIDKAVGIEERTGRRHEYQPYFSFSHTLDPEQRYYTVTSRIGPTDRYETYMVFDNGENDPASLKVESLSLDLHCTNGSLPREKLKERMINQLAPDVPKVAKPTNLTQPSLILYPPTRRKKAFFWKLISHWSFNFQTLASKEALAGLLTLYDWTDTDANPRRIAGLRGVTLAAKEVMYRGAILRGTEVTITIQEGHFADEGDLCLFGLVMSHFLAMYATLNSFVHLTIEMTPSGKRYQWQPKSGTRLTL